MISNPHVDDLHIKIIDSGHKNAVIGTTTIRTSDIMAQPDMEYSCQSFNLKGMVIRVVEFSSGGTKLKSNFHKTTYPKEIILENEKDWDDF